MESLGLSQKDAQSRNKWRRRLKGQLANPGSPRKMAVKMECVYHYTLKQINVPRLYFLNNLVKPSSI